MNLPFFINCVKAWGKRGDEAMSQWGAQADLNLSPSELDKDIAIQANHRRPNISSANSPWEMIGVNTLRPLMERMFKAMPEEAPFSEADTIFATGLLPCVSTTSSPA